MPALIGPSANQYAAPGVYITEQLLSTTPTVDLTSPSIAGFAGEHWRGPVGVAVQCNQWQDFVNYFGGFNQSNTPVLNNQWLPYAVYMFFANGGQTCWIDRFAGSSGQAASVTLQDSGSATPQDTLKLTAGFLGVNDSLGSWGNDIFVQVSPASTPNAFNLALFMGGTNPGSLVEQWSNLSMAPNSVRYAPTILNSVTSGSMYVYATDLFSPTASPGNNPATTIGTGGSPIALQFSGGVDVPSPTPSQRGAQMVYGSCAFDMVPGMLNMNLPGETDPGVVEQAITYASANSITPGGESAGRDFTFLVLDPPQGLTPSAAIAYMQTMQSSNNTSYAALYYPWVNAANPASFALQATILMPPGGMVLGQFAHIDTMNGPWYAPAGTNTALSGGVGLERKMKPQDFGALNLANVNALKIVPNTGRVVIFGARTLMTEYSDVYVPIRRTLNYIEAELSHLLQYAIFQPNNSLLWSTIIATCTQFLSGMAGRNAFQGTQARQQFYVICDDTINTPTTISQGIVNTNVGVALNYPAEFLQLTITQFQATGLTSTTSNIT